MWRLFFSQLVLVHLISQLALLAAWHCQFESPKRGPSQQSYKLILSFSIRFWSTLISNVPSSDRIPKGSPHTPLNTVKNFGCKRAGPYSYCEVSHIMLQVPFRVTLTILKKNDSFIAILIESFSEQNYSEKGKKKTVKNCNYFSRAFSSVSWFQWQRYPLLFFLFSPRLTEIQFTFDFSDR